jgi:hypothetical protein
MLKMQRSVSVMWSYIKSRVTGFYQNEKGELVGSIGWMAILATALVLVHGLITGWLPGFVGRIFSRMDLLVFYTNRYFG